MAVAIGLWFWSGTRSLPCCQGPSKLKQCRQCWQFAQAVVPPVIVITRLRPLKTISDGGGLQPLKARAAIAIGLLVQHRCTPTCSDAAIPAMPTFGAMVSDDRCGHMACTKVCWRSNNISGLVDSGNWTPITYSPVIYITALPGSRRYE